MKFTPSLWSDHQKTLAADLGLIFISFVWGSTFILVKYLMTQISVSAFVGYRFSIAAVLIGLALLLTKHDLRQNWKQGITLGLLNWIAYMAQTGGLVFTSAANSGLITGLFVAFVPLLSFLFFHRKPTALRIFAVVLSIAGLFVLTGGLQKVNIGDLMTLGTAISYAAHILLTDRFVRSGAHPLLMNFHQCVVVGVLGLLGALPLGQSLQLPSMSVAGILLFFAIFPTIVAFTIQLVSQKYSGPVKVALILALEPVFAVMFAWTVGHERFYWFQALGGLLIVLAMILGELPTRESA